MLEPPKPKMPSLLEIRQKTWEVLGYRPCLWQIRVVEAILRHDKDVVAIAATGSGKTLTFWMPLLFKKDGIQIVITPLNILGKQSVNSLAAMGIQGVTVTAENATRQTFKVSIITSCSMMLIITTLFYSIDNDFPFRRLRESCYVQ
jgi:superfamily II DNA helicase RecQ